jgi:hypothetical protein
MSCLSGRKRHFLNGNYNVIARKALEGWQITSVTRVQSGSPIRLVSNRATLNQNESGVVLHNLTFSQLQDMMQIRKTTNAQGIGAVYYLPQSLIDNSLAAFDLAPGKVVDPNQPYIGPPVAGQLGDRAFLYGPRQQKWDVSIVKKTMIGERGQRRVPCAGAERLQPRQLPAVHAGQQHHDYLERQLHCIRSDDGRLSRPAEHQ